MLSETNNTASFALQLCLEDLSEVCQHKINVSEKGDKPYLQVAIATLIFFFSRKETCIRMHEKCFKHCKKWCSKIRTMYLRSICPYIS